MERLTFAGLFCDIAMCTETPGGSFCEGRACSQRKTWERLKALEDILGDRYDLDRLRGLVEADKKHDKSCQNCKHNCPGDYETNCKYCIGTLQKMWEEKDG